MYGTVLALVASLLVGVFVAHAQMRGEQRRGGTWLRMACNIEGLWAQVAFDAKVPDAKLLKLRPDFQKAWDARESSGTAEPTDQAAVSAMVEKYDKIFTELVGSVKKNVSEGEFAKLSQSVETHQRVLEMVKQRMSGMEMGGPQPRPQMQPQPQAQPQQQP